VRVGKQAVAASPTLVVGRDLGDADDVEPHPVAPGHTARSMADAAVEGSSAEDCDPLLRSVLQAGTRRRWDPPSASASRVSA